MNFYLHVPFCRKKCAYCAFYSVENASPELHRRYLDKIEAQCNDIAATPCTAETLFIGGGTPNILTEPELERLGGILHRTLAMEPDAERTVECNPAVLTFSKLTIMRSFANRLSIGVQSFQPRLRKILGRDCDDRSIEQVFRWADQLHFDSVNLDLIYNIPTQTMQDWEEDLRHAAELGTDHLSCYSLTNEEGARLSDFALDDTLAAAMWERIPELSNMDRYEISNYARSGKQCRHNSNIWRGGTLLGLGPAAASFDGLDRWTQVSDVQRWLDGENPEYDRIGKAARLREIFAVNLRTVEGWNAATGREYFADQWDVLRSAAEAAAQNLPDVFDFFNGGVRLSRHGLLFWDDAAMALL